MTAYRQQALICAEALFNGPLRPRDIKPMAPDAGRILLSNVYGWFHRVSNGVYELTETGRQTVTLLHADRLNAGGAEQDVQ